MSITDNALPSCVEVYADYIPAAYLLDRKVAIKKLFTAKRITLDIGLEVRIQSVAF